MSRLSANLRFLLLATTLASATALPAAAQTVGSITILQPWSRATPNSAPVAAGYFTVTNKGEADKLIGGSTEVATKLEIHEMSMANGIMKMRELPNGLPVPASGTVDLKPSGYHLMFLGLKHGLKEGDHFKATLQFEKAGPVVVDFTVGSIAAMKAPDGGMQHGH
jgi:copper(I)-binding protein